MLIGVRVEVEDGRLKRVAGAAAEVVLRPMVVRRAGELHIEGNLRRETRRRVLGGKKLLRG